MLYNKTGMLNTIIVIAILSVTFFLILPVINLIADEGKGPVADSICSASVAAREKAFLQGAYTAGQIVRLYPLLCKTQELVIEPKTKDPKEEIQRQIADSIAITWKTFLEGNANNLFSEHIWGETQCFVYYTFKTKKSSNFKEGDKITASDFDYWLSTKTYSVQIDKDENAKTICEKNGGECIKGVCGQGKQAYSNWACGSGSGETCCVSNIVSYKEYVQSSGGPGRIFINNDEFVVGEVYSIAMVDPQNKWFPSGKFQQFLGKDKKVQAVYIDKLSDLSKTCQRVDDISGQ